MRAAGEARGAPRSRSRRTARPARTRCGASCTCNRSPWRQVSPRAPRARLALIRPPRGGNPKGGSARAPSDQRSQQSAEGSLSAVQQSAEVGHRKRRSERGISASTTTTTTLPRAARPRRRDARHEMDALRRDRRRGARSKRRLRPLVARSARRATRDRDGRAASIPPRCRPCRCRLVFSSRPVASRSRRLIPPTPHPPPSSSLAAAAAVPALPATPRRSSGRPTLVVFGGLNGQDRHRRHRRAAPRAQPMAPPAFVRGRRARPSRVPLRGSRSARGST